MDEKNSMSVMQAIHTRKSVRSYLDKPVEDEKLAIIMEAARLAPSASNLKEWRFVVVRKPEARIQIVEIAGSQKFLGEAGAIIVACADTDEHIMPCGQLSYPIDLAIALDHISLAAVEQGLGTCWIGNFEENKVKQLLGIPERIRIVGLMSLGYPADASPIKKNRLSIEKIVKYERW
jgi:nitroreductase